MQENNQENSFVIEKSFENAFMHYKDAIIRGVLTAGDSVPTVIVLHLNIEHMGNQQAYGVQGETSYPKLSKELKMRDYIVKLGEKYGRSIVAGKSDNLPVAILTFAEAYMGKKLNKGDEPKPLQDKNGNPINGAREVFIASGVTATGKQQFISYDIVRDENGVIIDLVQNDTDGDKTHNNMLFSFYTTIGEKLDKAGLFDKLRKGDDNDA